MDIKKLFSKMENTASSSYKIKKNIYAAAKIIRNAVIFPTTICLLLCGFIFLAADGLIYNGTVNAYLPQKSKPASKGLQASVDEPEEDLRDHTEELLKVLYDYDKTQIPEGKVGIVPVSLFKPEKDGKMYFSDSRGAGYKEYKKYLEVPLAVKYEQSEDYQILIIHTHGTEAYSGENELYTDPKSYPRSDNKEENVIAIGDVFEQVFNEAGIKTLHCEVPIDKQSYTNAYSNAAGIIKDYLKKYPTIKYMFDIHRDSIDMSDGSKARLVTAVNGQSAAQVMFVIGTDVLVEENKNWENNLSFAVKLQVALNNSYKEFCRPINIKKGAYNQFYTPLSVLIEIGSDGNDIEEAKRSAKLTAEQIVKTIKE